MQTHYIHFYGPINQVTFDRFKSICLQAIQQGAEELVFQFSSDGGKTIYGFTMYNFIKSLPVKTVMHNIGNIGSMAVVVYLASPKRLTSKHGRFIIHPLHWNFNAGQVDHSRLREFVAILDNGLERYAQIFNEQTKGAKEPLDILACLSGQEKVIGATSAVSAGIAHEIIDTATPKGSITWWVNST